MSTDKIKSIGPYDVIAPIGKGAMGEVYKAVQPSLNRVVAIKVLPPEFASDSDRVERFEREAKAVALISHPNVVQIIDKDEADGLLYFVMEYVAGVALSDILRRRRLSLREALTVFRDVLKGLKAAHAQGVVHRDLNPRNVLVSEDMSIVKVADFGISQVESISREMGTLSTSEVSLGTLHYMAPEQAGDMTKSDQRSDIYSAGVLLYEMLTGRVPVGRFNLPSQINTEVPSEIDPVVLKCLEVEPSDRYQTVVEVLAAVGRLEDRLRLGLVNDLRGFSRSTSDMFRRSTQELTVGSRRWPLRIAVLLTLGLGAAAAVWYVGREAAPLVAEAPATATAAVERIRVKAASEVPASDTGAIGSPLDVAEVPPFEGDEPEVQEAAVPDQSAAAAPSAMLPAPVPAQPTPEASQNETDEAQRRDLEVAFEKVDAKLYGPALADLSAFIDNYPDSPMLVNAFLMIGRIHQHEGRIEEAKATYVETSTRFKSQPMAGAALYALGEMTRAERGRERLTEARAIFGETAVKYKGTNWAARALNAKAQIETELRLEVDDPTLGKRIPRAVHTYLELVDDYPTEPSAEAALWALGEIYEDQRAFELAAGSFELLAERFAATKLDAWWKAGQIYDRRLDDVARAIACYDRVPRSSRRHADAQKRATKLRG